MKCPICGKELIHSSNLLYMLFCPSVLFDNHSFEIGPFNSQEELEERIKQYEENIIKKER
jgi:hypothetical protein